MKNKNRSLKGHYFIKICSISYLHFKKHPILISYFDYTFLNPSQSAINRFFVLRLLPDNIFKELIQKKET